MKLFNFLILATLSVFCINANAGLPEAKANFKRKYAVPSTAKFEESPFNGLYVVNSNGSINLFDEELTINGAGSDWEVRDDVNKQKFRQLTLQEAVAMQQVVRQNLRKDWLPSNPNINGDKSVIIISAPNCPVCQSMEKDLERNAKSIAVKIYYVPILLGQGSDEFTQAVMCASNPDDVWKRSLTMRNNYPKSNQECQKSNWVNMVIENTFERVNGDKHRIKTPAIIRTDGSVIFGWGGNASPSDIKTRFGF